MRSVHFVKWKSLLKFHSPHKATISAVFAAAAAAATAIAAHRRIMFHVRQTTSAHKRIMCAMYDKTTLLFIVVRFVSCTPKIICYSWTYSVYH